MLPASKRGRAWLLLGATLILLLLAVWVIGAESSDAAGQGSGSAVPRWAEVTLLVVLGGALLFGCLHVYPKAFLEGSNVQGPTLLTAENELRTLLVEVVGGAFLLAGLYLTYGQLQEAASQARSAREQAEVSKRQFADQRLESAMDRLANDSSAIRMLGLAALERLISDVPPDEKDDIYALFIGHTKREPWTAAKRAYWEVVLAQEEKLGAKDPLPSRENERVGLGSLRERAPDVQRVLSVAASGKYDLPGFRADFGDAVLQGAALGHARLPRALFNGAHLDHLDTRTREGPYADFTQAEFRGAKLYGAYLDNAELGGARFDSPDARQTTDLRYAQFQGASGVNAHFEGADLRNAVITPSRVRPASSRGAQFDGADLRGAVLAGADLSGADFDGSKLEGASFSGAKLEGASFKGAVLTGARFTDADLRGAHLEGAMLQDVNFDRALLTDTTSDASTTWPRGFQPPAP